MATDPTKGNSAYVNEMMAKSKANPTNSQKPGFIFVGVLFIVLFFGFKMCSDDRTPEQIAAAESLEQSKDLQVSAQVIAQNAVKAQLKSPSSADFPIGGAAVVSPEKNLFVVRSYVDSQNSFGAMMRNEWVVTLQYLGGDNLDDNNWSIKKVNFIQE